MTLLEVLIVRHKNAYDSFQTKFLVKRPDIGRLEFGDMEEIN